ncbi:MAG TPA: XrtA/PEP-CTERM system TPR-repeat protein PrsT [Telluria sp.]|nr:XrtA/PEP-CTERM system TPR-repeat protein PrsT [Telluria sp.]
MPRRVNQSAITAAVVSGVILLGGGLAGCNRTQSAQALLSDATQFQQKGDNKAALIQLKNASVQEPNNAEARLRLGMLYNDVGDSVSAEKELRKANAVGAAAATTLPALAQALLAQGKFQMVLDETQAASAKGDAAILSLRGQAYLGLREPAKAKEAFDQALKAQPGQLDALLGLARLAQAEKHSDEAMALTEQAIAAHPNDADGYFFKGLLLKAQGQQAQARAAFDKTLALKPAHRSAHLERAYLGITAQNFAAAQTDIDAARKTTPDNLMVVYTQALLDYTQGKYKAANDGLLKVLRVAPEHMPTILLSGATQLKLNSLPQAEQQLRKYLENAPADNYARKLLVTTLLQERRPGDAAAVLAPLVKETSQDPQVLALAGEINMQSRDFAKASENFQKASLLVPNAAALHGSLGMSKLGQGDNEAAIRELERATSLDAKSLPAGMALVRTEIALKHYDKALAAAKALEKELPDNPVVFDLEGGAYMGLKDVPNARASFEKAVKLKSDYFAAVLNLAQIDIIEKKPDDAKKRMEAFLEKNKKDVPAMTALAELATAQHHPEEATKWLEKASSENPDAIAPALRLAANHLAMGRKQQGLLVARKLQTANAANPEVLELLAQAQVANEDTNGALETLSKLVNVVPKRAAPHFQMALLHAKLNNLPAAEQDLNAALALEPNFTPALAAKAELAVQQGKPDQALAIARQMQKADPKSPRGYGLEGDLLLKQSKFAPAARAYEQASARADEPLTMIRWHQATKGAGQAKEADARLAQWLAAHPADVLVPLYLGETAMASKQYKPAIAQYQAVIKQQPNNTMALNNLAWAYYQEKDARALATGEQALRLDPNNPAAMDTVGWILTEQGNVARGLPLLKKAAALAPQAPELHYHLAAGLNKSGDKAGARAELEKLLASNKPFAAADEARALLKQL